MTVITALTDPSQMPNQLDDQETFDTKTANYMDGLVERARQENELVANLNALAAGGVYGFPYVFDSSTADSDPGVWKLRLGSTTQNAATSMRIDLQAVGGADMTNVLADLRAATSAVKGSIRLVKMTDPSKWLIFDVTAVALPSGYRNLTVSWRATGGGLASPFANGDALMVFIDRNGDSGTVPGATELLAEMNISTAVTTVAFPNVFDSAHDWYLIDIQHLQGGLSAQPFSFRFYFNGAEGADTQYVAVPANGTSSTKVASFPLSPANNAANLRGLVQVRGVNSPNRKDLAFDGTCLTNTAEVQGIGQRGFYDSSNNPSGFGLRGNTTISAALVRVYGVRKV
ncbi:hypothetical protein [Massilia sp. CFBP9026]|uniref:hypothetical protein n=1 Tax=Massilia sp. CFBP9026 TaxID=3096536 RepID=UPI002A6A07BE|nr:hypothetical protein [Massilia sp. CFBP9026]MDY0961731.1 hypothetical protein [Massilia sp. CFBP9026]